MSKLSPEQKQIKELRRELRAVRDAANDFYRSVAFPNKTQLWTYPLNGTAYSMEYLHQRCVAANQLGFDCLLLPTMDDGKNVLKIIYVKRPIPRPWQFDY